MPVTHNTTPPQASQEIVRSSARTKAAPAKAACNTLTPKRMAAKEVHTGNKMSNKASA